MEKSNDEDSNFIFLDFMFEILFLLQKMKGYYAMHLFLSEKVRDFRQGSYYLNGNVMGLLLFLCSTLFFP